MDRLAAAHEQYERENDWTLAEEVDYDIRLAEETHSKLLNADLADYPVDLLEGGAVSDLIANCTLNPDNRYDYLDDFLAAAEAGAEEEAKEKLSRKKSLEER